MERTAGDGATPNWSIEIADLGQGMSEEDVRRAVRPLYRGRLA